MTLPHKCIFSLSLASAPTRSIELRSVHRLLPIQHLLERQKHRFDVADRAKQKDLRHHATLTLTDFVRSESEACSVLLPSSLCHLLPALWPIGRPFSARCIRIAQGHQILKPEKQYPDSHECNLDDFLILVESTIATVEEILPRLGGFLGGLQDSVDSVRVLIVRSFCKLERTKQLGILLKASAV